MMTGLLMSAVMVGFAYLEILNTNHDLAALVSPL